jgi:hypothetical protein
MNIIIILDPQVHGGRSGYTINRVCAATTAYAQEIIHIIILKQLETTLSDYEDLNT